MRFAPILLVVAVAAAGIAAAPTPKPKPTPTPSPTALPTVQSPLPLIVVFPFDSSSNIKAGTGDAAAQVFVRSMNADGGVDTIEGPPTVKRTDFLSYARGVSAAYYVTGYMTPLGNGVSLVEQVVSTLSGAIVFGQTAQIESINDATAQATYIHDGILEREKALSDAYTQAQAQATSAPSSNPNQADIGKGISGLAGLFHHGKNGATPAPAAKPSKGVFVAHVSGALPAGDLTAATSELYRALDEKFVVHSVDAAGATLAKTADSICGAQRNNTIATGTLSTQSEHHTFGARVTYAFTLQMYTCFGALLAEAKGSGGNASAAIRQAVQTYANEHPQNA